MVDIRVDKVLDVEILASRMKRRKKEVRSEQEISPSMYASAKPMSLASSMRGQADEEWIKSSMAGALFLWSWPSSRGRDSPLNPLFKTLVVAGDPKTRLVTSMSWRVNLPWLRLCSWPSTIRRATSAPAADMVSETDNLLSRCPNDSLDLTRTEVVRISAAAI